MASNQFDQRIVELVNQERTSRGLNSLELDSRLDKAANLHNDEMVNADEMSHQLPGEAGLGDRVSESGYEWNGVAENISVESKGDPEDVMKRWMNSPGHRGNILNPNMTDIGVGYEDAPDNRPYENGNTDGKDFDTYWTQVFGAGDDNDSASQKQPVDEIEQPEPTAEEPEEPVDEPIEEPVDEVDEPESTPEEPKDEPMEEPKDDSKGDDSEEPVDEMDDDSEEPVDEPMEEPKDDSGEQPVDEVDDDSEEPVDEPMDEPKDDSGEQPVDEVNNPDLNPDGQPVEEGNNFDETILDLFNAERAAAGLDLLEIDSQLDQAADLHTNEMVQGDKLSNQLPGEASLGDRVSATGYEWRGLSESVAGGFDNPEALVDGLMDSPNHRANILNPDFTHLGTSSQKAPDDIADDADVYWTQVFGMDASSMS